MIEKSIGLFDQVRQISCSLKVFLQVNELCGLEIILSSNLHSCRAERHFELKVTLIFRLCSCLSSLTLLFYI